MNFRRYSLLLLLCFVFVAQIASAQSTVVISQVYGGGGNAGATFKNDFIEIFNRGTSPQSLAGWSVQYASSAGSSWQVTNLTAVSLAPGQYYLIQEAAGAGGTTSLPTPDATGSGTGINMSATAGKVALVSSTTALTCGATNNCPANPAILDLVGFGTIASSFEGAGPTGTLSNTTAALRASSGCTDSNNNASDFAIGAPAPRNTGSPIHTCVAVTPTLAISNVSAFEGDSGTTNFNFTVSLTGGTAPPGGVTFDIATADGSATIANNDYVAKALTAQNVTSTYTFTVLVNGDVDVEPNETFTVNVTNITGATNTSAQATGTIVNDDSPTPPTGTGSANPSSLAVGDTTTLTVNVTPGVKPASTGITVTADLSAIGGSVQPLAGSGNTFTLDAVVATGTTLGAKTIPVTISDSQGRSSGTSISLTIVQPPPPADHVVISQVYGGGGNSGATYTNDFVELYNPTNIPFDLTGWTIQYASASGTAWNNFQTLGGTIGPGEYYLISLASGGATGDPLPSANVYGSINMSATTGKIALVRNGTVQSGACPISSPNPDVIDFVGYGSSATCSEGNLSAPAPSNTTADLRKNNGSTDTNINRNDFVAGTPTPRRTATIAEIGPSVVNTDPALNGTTAPHDGSVTVNFSEPVDVDAAWYNINCAVTGLHNDATVAHTSDFKSYVITPNVNFQFGETCAVTIIKDAVHDQDTNDSAPNTDTLFADYNWTFTVVGAGQPAPYPPSVHLTMGNPTNAVADVNQPNNYLMVKPTYALSYNRDNGRPNWVSWHLDNSWFGSLARVDTFRADPAVPPDWYRVAAFDFSFSGFDRGHMCPNADRDNENRIPINQETYLMSNMVAQAPDNNQGPWANLENDLRTIVSAGDTELYIVSGPAGVGGVGSNGAATILANGHVLVPAYTWKAALVLPKGDNDLSRVTAATRTIAVIMPNVQGIRNNDWHTYLTTVDAVEALCVCDLFSNVPASIQNSIEAGINGVNPPGTADQSVSTNEDNAKSFTLDAVSPNNAPITYTIVTSPSHGVLSGSDGSRTYTPAPDFNGNDSFTYFVSDGTHNSNTSTVSISVLEVNDPPIATDDAKSTDEDTPLTFASSDLTANDSTGPANESSQTLTVTAVTATANTHGTATLTSGVVSYIPEANYNGPASFTYSVCDNGITAGLSDPLCSTATVNVTVNEVNDPPTASDDAKTTDEDTPLIFASSDLTANDSTGPANESSQTLTVTAVTATANTHGTVTLTSGVVSYIPAANYNGPASFTYRVCDNGVTNGHSDSLCATATVNVTVNPVNDPPTASIVTATTSPEGTPVTATANVSDPDANESFTYAWSVTKNGSPYASGSNSSINFTPDDNGAYLVSLTVTDASGATGSDSRTVNVTNVAPVITSATLSSAAIDENGSVTISGTFTDPGTADTHTVIVNWGDGSANSTAALTPGSRVFSLAHQYLDDAPSGTPSDVYAISVTVADDDAGIANASTSVTVNNVAPTINAVTGPTGPLQLGTAASINISYSDVGTLDTHTAVITWDDGSSSPATCASGTCTATHTYAAAGVYAVGISLSDDDTGNATAEFDYVVVYDPSAGFVTGGGWINSPAGAYLADPTVTGKATFGFNSKYLKGQSTPSGNTQFQLHEAKLDFSSTSIEWLVVAGAKAQYKGTGTVNGTGQFGFLVTATDGNVTGGDGVDKFRIKIWDKVTGNTVYDNALGSSTDIDSANPQPIGGGSINIQK